MPEARLHGWAGRRSDGPSHPCRSQFPLCPNDHLSRYYADYHYAIPTVAFCLAFVGVFAVCNFVAARVNRTTGAKSTSYRRIIAVSRYCTYKRFHVAPLGWYTPPLGQLLMAGVGIIFFFCRLGLHQTTHSPVLLRVCQPC